MVRTFRQWKACLVIKLLSIKKKYEGNEKVERDVDALLSKVERLKARDLASFLLLLHYASTDAPEFLELLPTEEEVLEWLEREEE